MKKLILLGTILLSSLSCIFAEEPQNNAIAQHSGDNLEASESEKQFELYPKNHKTFFLSVANQITLMNKLLTTKGSDEVTRYFLSLKQHNEQKALELLAKEGDEDLRLVILENLPTQVFAELLKTLFEPIGGQAIAHWGYKANENNEQTLQKTFMTPPARAQQYINFFMSYKTSRDVTQYMVLKATQANEEILKARGKKIAKVLNGIDEKIVIDLLYGRLDTRFIGDKDKILPSKNGVTYETLEKQRYDNEPRWYEKNQVDFDKFTKQSRVYAKSINYIIPHLSPRLIVAVFAKETNGNNDALISMIQSIGCEKALNELFEHLEDNIKDKVFESCSNDKSLLDILGLDETSNDLPQLGDGADKKDL